MVFPFGLYSKVKVIDRPICVIGFKFSRNNNFFMEYIVSECRSGFIHKSNYNFPNANDASETVNILRTKCLNVLGISTEFVIIFDETL